MKFQHNKVLGVGHFGNPHLKLEDVNSQHRTKEVKTLSNLVSGNTKQGGIKSQDDINLQIERSGSLPVDNHYADNNIHNQENGFQPLESNLDTGEVALYSSPVCIYSKYCNVKKMKENCVDYKNCQTWKFYNKYPNWNEMFIGSMI